MKNKLLIIILTFIGLTANAHKYMSYSDINYKDEVHTVLLHPTDFELDKPVILLDDMLETLHLQFDIFADEAPYLYYTFIHCDNNWQPTDLPQNDYINGFFQDDIDNFNFSMNTYVNYVHYDLYFPQEEMMPKLSGNYLLVVTGKDPEDIYFTRRFYILETMASVDITMPRYPFDLNLGPTKQEVNLDIYIPDIFAIRADQYTNVTIQQNGRWDNAVFGIKPTYTYPEKLSYNHNYNTVFESGNQYLRINTSNFRNRPEKTRTVYLYEDNYVVTLYEDTQRNTHLYSEDQDLFGEKHIYLEDETLDPTREADYAMVEFFLQWPQYMINKDVYILGAITDWRLDENSKMEYDPERQGYKKGLLLKQGYYDYMYIVKDNETGISSLAPINGDFWETVNMYHIFVYLFDPIQNYDKLVGYATIRSH